MGEYNRLVKEDDGLGDGYRNLSIFPLDVTSIPCISAASVSPSKDF